MSSRLDRYQRCSDALKKAQVTDLGAYTEVRFSDRQNIGTDFKATISYRFSTPVLFAFNFQSGYRREWWTQGVCYNPHGPAIEFETAQERKTHYHMEGGTVGREEQHGEGPITVDHEFGVVYKEHWEDRPDGPSYVELRYASPSRTSYSNFSENSDSIKGLIGEKETVNVFHDRSFVWNSNGKLGRGTGPNNWSQQYDTGIAEYTSPSTILSVTKTMVVVHRELRWYHPDTDQLHRTDGPAIIKLQNVKETSKDGRASAWIYGNWGVEWHINGKKIPAYKVHQWAKRHNISMVDNPCYDRSMWNEETELCFMTDFG